MRVPVSGVRAGWVARTGRANERVGARAHEHRTVMRSANARGDMHKKTKNRVPSEKQGPTNKQ